MFKDVLRCVARAKLISSEFGSFVTCIIVLYYGGVVFFNSGVFERWKAGTVFNIIFHTFENVT